MPYGTIRQDTELYLLKRAGESGVTREQLGLSPDLDFTAGTLDEVNPIPENCYEISVIYHGSLDESFYVVTDYEVNIADWIAEMLKAEADADADYASWEVIVTEVCDQDAGSVRYRTSHFPEQFGPKSS